MATSELGLCKIVLQTNDDCWGGVDGESYDGLVEVKCMQLWNSVCADDVEKN